MRTMTERVFEAVLPAALAERLGSKSEMSGAKSRASPLGTLVSRRLHDLF